MQYRIVKAGDMYRAEKRGCWFEWLIGWQEICYKGYRLSKASAEDDIRTYKSRRNPEVIEYGI